MACSNPSFNSKVLDLFGRQVPIPCGKCMCCRIDIQKKLVDRMFCAYYSHPTSAFVTFTYDDKHLFYPFEGSLNPSLSKDDVHLYLDNIRHRLKNTDFEYFICGEYGDSFGRPHYHALFFGLDYQLYKNFFENSWKKGSVKVLPCDSKCFRYVSKYVTKDGFYNDSQYFDYGLTPPFHTYSRGLGVSQFISHQDEICKNGFFVLNSRKIFVNKYYFNKLVPYNDEIVLLKENQLSKIDRDFSDEASRFGLSVLDYQMKNLSNKESNLLSKCLKESSHF